MSTSSPNKTITIKNITTKNITTKNISASSFHRNFAQFRFNMIHQRRQVTITGLKAELQELKNDLKQSKQRIAELTSENQQLRQQLDAHTTPISVVSNTPDTNNVNGDPCIMDTTTNNNIARRTSTRNRRAPVNPYAPYVSSKKR